ncbi:hypothetical protein CDAR_91611 [Caerostris darwini]|uniref:Uncharacterized protein n=1 Tax=Caerostris darwini TaxID=1538125 RepID=A0AAV4Q7E2_9ARAC|nr:hypothetical protein CDAR_91611 [Caerostris darwini]
MLLVVTHLISSASSDVEEHFQEEEIPDTCHLGTKGWRRDHKKERNHRSDPLTESLTQACSEDGRKRYLTHVIWAPRVRGDSEGRDHKKERNHRSDPLTESLTQACSEDGF